MNKITKEKIKLFKTIYQNKLDNEKYLNSIPKDIRDSFFDNEYTNRLNKERELLIKEIFKEQSYSIEWFLDEWTEGAEVGFNNKTTKINNIEDYIRWIVEVEGFI